MLNTRLNIDKVTHMLKSSSLPSISILHKTIPALAGVNKYQHQQEQCIYVHSGVLAIVGENGRYFVPPQQAIIIPAEYSHEIIAKSEVSLSILYFDAEQAISSFSEPSVIATSVFLRALMTESKTISTSYLWESTDGRLLRLIKDKIVDSPSLDIFLPYPSDERLTNITARILKHPSLKSDLVSWGKFVSASPRTLSRVFKKETGITYSEWRQRLNIQIAIKHLSLGDSISEIATLLGYESSSAFIYMFKKQMGVSPNQFLKTELEVSGI